MAIDDFSWLQMQSYISTVASGATGPQGATGPALGGSYIGLSINGGASAAWTVTQVWAECNW